LQSRPTILLFEGANPRHEHEWEAWQSVDIPDDKVLAPGVIDSTNNFIEHPRLVAQRLRHYADIVGADRVIASTDCGFGTFAGLAPVDTEIAYAKLAAMCEGAALV
jgi:5-methyltetrahydropteroyltriglutamate--homocysteine methyltransferase